MRRNEKLKTVLEGDRHKAIRELFGQAGSIKSSASLHLLSADLTAATDRMPFWVTKVVWDVIMSNPMWPQWCKDVANYSTGEMELIYDKDH